MKLYVGIIACLLVLAALTGCGGSDRVIQRFRVEGHAMSPTLEDGEEVEVLDYSGAVPARGDIIAFVATTPDRLFVKRVIGVPGDSVEIDGVAGDVMLNGQVLQEPYASGFTGCAENCFWTVPKASTPESQRTCGSNLCFFVLGDNRQNSADSRTSLGLVPVENIVGFIKFD